MVSGEGGEGGLSVWDGVCWCGVVWIRMGFVGVWFRMGFVGVWFRMGFVSVVWYEACRCGLGWGLLVWFRMGFVGVV